jgi:thiol-disulfide isomerase/thioredoxin
MHILPAVTCGTFLSLICCVSTAFGEGPPAPQSAPLRKLTVRLVDASGKPVAGAHVGLMAHFWRKFLKPEAADDDGFTYNDHSVSDAKGIAQIELPADEFKEIAKRRCLVARHAGRGLVAIADLGPATIQAPFDLTLVPECRVSGKLLCTDLAKRNRNVGWSNVELYVGKKRILWCASEEDGNFHFFLPPGRYRFHAYGTYLSHSDHEITVPAGKRELTTTLSMAATRFALLQGLPAPELNDIVAWKNSKPLKLSDLRGKCVLLDFWGHWCNPCVQGMPGIFRWHDQLAKEGLVVIGIHVEYVKDRPVDSVQRLDEKLVSTRKNIWHGRDIPYAVAIARPVKPCPVVEAYGINGFPSLLLIDRRGNLVDTVDDDEAGLALVKKCLAEKAPVAVPRSDIH